MGGADALAQAFGHQFAGRTRGQTLITTFAQHPVTKGVAELNYAAGSGLTSYPAQATILARLPAQGFLDTNNNGVRDPHEMTAPPVMGVLTLGSGMVVFAGDTNLWQTLPQPLTANTINWLTDS